MLQKKKREKVREEIVNYGQGKKKRKENQEKKGKWVERGQQDRRQ